jgi:hypothetical protein
MLILVTSHYCAALYLVLGFQLDGKVLRTWPELMEETRANGVAGEEPFFTGLTPSEIIAERYVTALYYVICLLTAVGLQITPANVVELCFALLMMVANLTAYAVCVGQIAALVMRQDDEIVGKRAQLELVQAYLSHMRLPMALKTQIELFFQARLKDASISSVTDEQIYDMMSVSLQIAVSTHTNRELVGDLPLLRGCSETFLDRLSSLLRERTVEPETYLFRVGDACRDLFIIDTGMVEVFDEASEADEAQVSLCEPGDSIGNLSFVFRMRHFNNARSTGKMDTSVFVLTLERYNALVKMFPVQEDIIMDNAMLENAGGARARGATWPVAVAGPICESLRAARLALERVIPRPARFRSALVRATRPSLRSRAHRSRAPLSRAHSLSRAEPSGFMSARSGKSARKATSDDGSAVGSQATAKRSSKGANNLSKIQEVSVRDWLVGLGAPSHLATACTNAFFCLALAPLVRPTNPLMLLASR